MLEERRGNNSQINSDGLLDGFISRFGQIDSVATIPVSSSLPSSSATAPSSPSPSSSASPGGAKHIEHRVSKMDTLAGIAIKYGVEVADIKRLNGLVTDLQMFAHKSLLIPLPGRHPPSPCPLNGSVDKREVTPPRRRSSSVLDLVRSLNTKPPLYKVSPAMSNLQGYSGLTPPRKGPFSEGTEMAVYGSGRRSLDGELLFSEVYESQHWKSRSLANMSSIENVDFADANSEATDVEKPIRRRQKADEMQSVCASELVLKEESSNGFLTRAWKGLALRPKAGSRTDADTGRLNGFAHGDSSTVDAFVSVRKSSSASSLHDSQNSSSLRRTSIWSFKPEAFTMPILDGLPMPITAWKSKAALD